MVLPSKKKILSLEGDGGLCSSRLLLAELAVLGPVLRF